MQRRRFRTCFVAGSFLHILNLSWSHGLDLQLWIILPRNGLRWAGVAGLLCFQQTFVPLPFGKGERCGLPLTNLYPSRQFFLCVRTGSKQAENKELSALPAWSETSREISVCFLTYLAFLKLMWFQDEFLRAFLFYRFFTCWQWGRFTRFAPAQISNWKHPPWATGCYWNRLIPGFHKTLDNLLETTAFLQALREEAPLVTGGTIFSAWVSQADLDSLNWHQRKDVLVYVYNYVAYAYVNVFSGLIGSSTCNSCPHCLGWYSCTTCNCQCQILRVEIFDTAIPHHIVSQITLTLLTLPHSSERFCR